MTATTDTTATSTEDHADRDSRALVTRYAPLALLGVAAVVVSVVVRHAVFPAYSWNRDEPVYVWQVNALRQGFMRPPDGGFPRFFWPWLSGHAPGYFFSQYTLGWPLVLLAADVVVGAQAGGIAFGALLAVLGTYAFARTVTRDHAVALVAAGVMVLSPVFVIQSGVYLGYLFTLGLGLLAGSALLSGFAHRRRLRIVAGGAALGWVFMTRPFDALLWALAFGGFLLLAHRHELRRVMSTALWAAAGAAPLVIATLLYNRHVTGSFTQFPITAADPKDTFGFGLRRIMPELGPEDYTLFTAVKSEAKNALAVPWFLFGSYLALLASAVVWWRHRRERWTWALLLLGAVFPVGYFFFWGLHVSGTVAHLSGPIYFIPAFGALAVFIAVYLVGEWRRATRRGILVTAVLVLVTVPFMVDRIGVNHDISAAQEPWKTSTQALHGHDLVFVEQSGSYLISLNPFSSNTAQLDGPILYATDNLARDISLIREFPDRTPYLQRTTQPPRHLVPREHPPVPRISFVPLHVLEAGVMEVRETITNPTDSPVVVATLTVGTPTVATAAQEVVIDRNSHRGATYEHTWRVATPDAKAAPACGAGCDAVFQRQFNVIRVQVGFGATEAGARGGHLRTEVFSRVDGPKAEVLLPARTEQFVVLDRFPGWIPAENQRTLHMTVTAADASSAP